MRRRTRQIGAWVLAVFCASATAHAQFGGPGPVEYTEALGHTVVSLERVTYANLTTDGVRRGKWRRLHAHEVRKLRKLVHLK